MIVYMSRYAVVAALGGVALILSATVGVKQNRPSREISALLSRPCELRSDGLTTIDMYFHPQIREPDCGYVEAEGWRIESLFRTGPYGEYRFAYITSRLANPEHFILYLAGGPRQQAVGFSRNPLNSLPAVRLAADLRTAVIAPDYLGTAFRSRYPEADVPAAAEEMVELITRLRTIHPNARVTVVSVSAGALVALRMLHSAAIPTVLVVPSPESLERLLLQPAGTDLPANAATRTSRFYRLLSDSPDRQLVAATMFDQMRAFAGEDFGKSLSELISAVPAHNRSCLSIVYATADRRVRNAELVTVREAHPVIPVVAVEGLGHAPRNAGEAELLTDAITSAIPTSCGQ